MNKEEIEKEEGAIKISMPLLTQEEINGIDLNMNEIVNKFTKMLVKEKDFVIAQHIMQRQQEKIEKLEQKESILDKVTEFANKIATENAEKYNSENQKEVDFSEWNLALEILNIIEGEKKQC